MAEFFQNRFDEIFQINDYGDILKLSTDTGEWKFFSDFDSPDIGCKPCSASFLNNIQMAIYFKKSELAFSNNCSVSNFSFGKNFSFFEDGAGKIFCIDENNNEYFCGRDFVRPVERGSVNEKWTSVSSDSVFNKIMSFDPNFIKELELYILEIEDIDELSGALFEKIPSQIMDGIKELYSYLKKNWKSGITSGKDFLFYKNNFGCIYARDEKYNEYICNDDFLVPVRKKSIKSTWDSVDKYSVIKLVKRHSNHKKSLAYKEIDLGDLDLYISRGGCICGVTEDGRNFKISKVTGELEPVKKCRYFRFLWKNFSKIQAIKYQFRKREEYKGISALNDYLKMCNDIEIKKSGKEIGKNLKFYKNDFGRIFAKDDNYNEYVCEEGYMIPLVNKGSAVYLWEPVEPSQVPYMIKAYADMVRGICEKNSNLKAIHKYIKENEKRELEKSGKAFGYNFRFFVNGVGYVFAKDEHNREYFCKPSEMTFVKDGTIDEKNWDSILESDAIKYLR